MHGRHEVEHVDLLAGPREQLRETLKAAVVLQANDGVVPGDGPEVAFASEDGGRRHRRLLSPDPEWHLAVPIARSQPIRIDGSILPPPPPPPPPPPVPGASCDDGSASACNDGDPCTEDACVPGVGCVSSPASGFASVTCTCGRGIPAACADQELPASIGGRRQRACGLFAAAAGTARRPLVIRRLRRAVQTLNGSIHLVGSRRRTVSAACAGALKGELRDARDRTTRLLATGPSTADGTSSRHR
jgi:hypothetical protein